MRTTENLNLRAGASMSANVLRVLPQGTQVEAERSALAEGWHTVQMSIAGSTFKAQGYLRSAYLAPAVLDVVPAKARLGVHLLNPMSEHSGYLGEQAFAAGCRVFTVIDDEQYAISLANRGARVFFRWWIGENKIAPADLAGRVAGFCRTPGITILGLNEGDVTGCFTAEQMEARGKWDTEAFRRITDLGGQYAGFGCAVGNPEYNDVRLCGIVNKHYAPLWSQGMRINYHAYSPAPSRIFSTADYDWFEGRWRMLFTRCGLEPANPAKSEIVGDEAGLDQDGSGGFKQAGFSDEQVRAWCVKHFAAQAAPLVVNGVSYPSPYTDATIFQMSESVRWAGYRIGVAGVKWA